MGIFEVGDTVVMALYYDYFETGMYYLDGCRLSYLNYSDNMISGYINGTNETQEYAFFSSNIENCILGVDIEDQDLSTEIQIYPTLTTDKINIQAEKNRVDSVHIYSFNGELLKQIHSSTSQLTVDTMDLPKGVYFIAVQTKGQTITKKVVKM